MKALAHEFIRFTTVCAVALAPCVAATGCDAFRGLRQFFHPEGRAPADEAPRERRMAGLRVDVIPDTGITILVDGAKVAQRSPYIDEHLQPGRHTLKVRAMGHYPFTLPFVLAEGEMLKIPVSLRPREHRRGRRRGRSQQPGP